MISYHYDAFNQKWELNSRQIKIGSTIQILIIWPYFIIREMER